MLVYPLIACICSWLIFIIGLYHGVDVTQFSVAIWGVVLWGWDSKWYLLNQFSISHLSCPFHFQSLSQGFQLHGNSIPTTTTTLKWNASWGVFTLPWPCFGSALDKRILPFYSRSEEWFCLDSCSNDASLSSFSPVSVVVSKEEMISSLPCQFVNWTCFVHFTLGCAVSSFYMMEMFEGLHLVSIQLWVACYSETSLPSISNPLS